MYALALKGKTSPDLLTAFSSSLTIQSFNPRGIDTHFTVVLLDTIRLAKTWPKREARQHHKLTTPRPRLDQVPDLAQMWFTKSMPKTCRISTFRSTWELGARNNPLYLKRRDLRPLARSWHKFIIHNILPTSNQSEVTVKRVVLIHCIIHGQDVRVEKLIAKAMTDIVKDLHTTRHPLAFPNVIARLCEAAGVSYQAPNSKEAVPKIRPITAAVMENIRYPHHQPHAPPPQPQQYVGEGEHQEQPAYDAQMPQGYGWGTTQVEFYESILAQNASYGLRLREIDVKQNDMWAEQSQFYKDVRAYQEQQKEYQKLQQEQFQQIQPKQAQIHKEFTNYKKNFSTHMGKINKNFED
ncbi:hypothetical protein PIB30_084687 [Stylosanthes scabra]|uniref:Putative plant transposon protein domain-containing protein n=1 Tax=Stylosanthes scabra TaxID=79078 RepID=A0ABU6STP9_9FABA|nr:hypothetical protein [Stylosanthes scabra]